MSQLQYLEIVDFDHSILARSFIPLGSLSQLKSLKIGTSFFAYCSLEENPEDDPDFAHEIFLSVDSYNMFSGLTALEHLSISAHQYGHPGHLWRSISAYCSRLSSLEFVGELDLWSPAPFDAVKFNSLTDLTIDELRVTDMADDWAVDHMATCRAIRVIDNFAPKLQRLQCTTKSYISQQICTDWTEVHTPEDFFQDQD
ncbi:unnamed protein product [Aureobasidium mustum]|uniref:Uncharacterized protein n=1 Tax=Aureobasidium mustum TaxID=2773714 RepID=A0A9N8K754_9PEZI|nr:unnamed protein product [Aureobasidium mustum]